VAVITADDSSSQSSYSSKFIVEVQGDLKQLGYYEGAVDGQYGPKTVAAIKAFQKDQGIAVTGNIDQGTYSYLVAALGDYAN
jgi:peptidoglycan hydrolase-like protein with peptidoglycan-binding domain